MDDGAVDDTEHGEPARLPEECEWWDMSVCES